MQRVKRNLSVDLLRAGRVSIYIDLRRFFAITTRCISLVPSPIVQSLLSRQYFSAG